MATILDHIMTAWFRQVIKKKQRSLGFNLIVMRDDDQMKEFDLSVYVFRTFENKFPLK